MAICIVALFVFGILSIFSASYRPLFNEALDCTFLKVQFKPCKSGLDKKIKLKTFSKLRKFSPKLANLSFKYFEPLSVVFTLIFFWSMLSSVYGAVNYVKYGNCNGPVNEGFCVFDAAANTLGQKDYSGISKETNLIRPQFDFREPYIGKKEAKLTILEFGCYRCTYTKRAEPIVKQLLNEYEEQINFQFIDYPVLSHPDALISSIAVHCMSQENEDAFFKYRSKILESEEVLTEKNLKDFAKDLDIDHGNFQTCLELRKTEDLVKTYISIGKSSGIFGTPTFFIGNTTIVGPERIELFRKAINKELSK